MLQTILNILIMLVMLGVLISLHEAGHLAMAKLFRVYCFEYSIGFGPAFLHKKRKNGETYFTMRVIPLGGYVSMYGEEGAAPEGMELPPKERSLESKKWWQKILIMVAGVTVNYVLGLVLIFVAVSAFTWYYRGYSYSLTNSSGSVVLNGATCPISFSKGEYKSYFDAATPVEGGTKYEAKDYALFLGVTIEDSYSLLDGEVKMYDGTGALYGEYAAVYNPSGLTNDHSFTGDITLYALKRNATGGLISRSDTMDGFYPYEIDFSSSGRFQVQNLTKDDHYSIDLDLINLPIYGVRTPEMSVQEVFNKAYANRLIVPTKISSNPGAWKDIGLTMKAIGEKNSWNDAWASWAHYVPWASGAIVQGFASIFTQGLSNVTGIIGMTAEIGTVMSMGGASLLFLYAGLISINLAFFNLLPFPGLDGWQILVVAFETISHKKMPEKAKGIANMIGFGILIVLAIVIVIKDIVGLVV